jgi:hypothetical protein
VSAGRRTANCDPYKPAEAPSPGTLNRPTSYISKLNSPSPSQKRHACNASTKYRHPHADPWDKDALPAREAIPRKIRLGSHHGSLVVEEAAPVSLANGSGLAEPASRCENPLQEQKEILLLPLQTPYPSTHAGTYPHHQATNYDFADETNQNTIAFLGRETVYSTISLKPVELTA